MIEKPLTGKRIVVTRAPEQARELICALEQMGAEVLLMAVVCFAPIEDSRELDAALKRIGEFDWILFTSQNAVRFVCQRCRELGLDVALLSSPDRRIAAVGPATADTAAEEGIRVDYVAKNQSGESLARELRNSLHGREVLLPRSDRGDEHVAAALRDAGAGVTEAIAYRTASPKSLDPAILQSIRRAEVNAIVFASPSAFQNLATFVAPAELASLSERIQFAAIGPTTARALRQEGIRVEIEANESSAAGLSDAVAKYYQRQPSSSARRA